MAKKLDNIINFIKPLILGIVYYMLVIMTTILRVIVDIQVNIIKMLGLDKILDKIQGKTTNEDNLTHAIDSKSNPRNQSELMKKNNDDQKKDTQNEENQNQEVTPDKDATPKSIDNNSPT